MTRPELLIQQDHVASTADGLETVLTDALPTDTASTDTASTDTASTDTALTDTVMQTRRRSEELEVSPRPLKCVTPLQDVAATGDQDDSPIQRNPDVVQYCSHRIGEDTSVETDLTKSLRSKFEKGDGECPPLAVTVSNLKAKFEAAISDGSVCREHGGREAATGPQTHRRAKFSWKPTTDVCSTCHRTLYPMERMEVSGDIMHRNCFRCSHCRRNLRLANYAVSGGNMYCGPHYRQLFMTKGNYDEGFGRVKFGTWLAQERYAASEKASSDDGEQGHIGAFDEPANT